MFAWLNRSRSRHTREPVGGGLNARPRFGAGTERGIGYRLAPTTATGAKLLDRLLRLDFARLGEAPALDAVSALERPGLAQFLEPAQVAEHHVEPE